MNRLRHKRFSISYTALSFLLPFAGLLLLRLFCSIAFNGTYSMLYSDCYHQYYPFFVDFHRALRSGDSLLYNWGIGMGINYLGLIPYYLASPLNLISVLLPEKWLLGYFSLLMPLKLSFAGLFFSILLKKLFGKDDWAICIFSSFYAYCAWALGYQWNIMWLDTFALLPLVILGMICLLRERKFLLYCISLFLAISINYFIGFFVCIFVLLSFICYEVCYCKSVGQFFSDILSMALFSLIAIGMTAFLTLPAYSALQTTQSSVNTFPTGFRLNIAKENTLRGLLVAMVRVAGNASGGIQLTFKEGMPNLFCGVITNFLLFFYLLNGGIKLRQKICTVMLLLLFNISFIIRQLDYIWHGFHFTNMLPYRFSFLYSFVMLIMAYQGWLRRHEMRLWHIFCCSLLSIGLCLCSEEIQPFFHLISGKTALLPWTADNVLRNIKTISAGSAYFLFNFLFLVAYTAVFLYGRAKSENPEQTQPNTSKPVISMILIGIMMVELTMVLINFGIWFPGTDVSNYPKEQFDAEAAINAMQEREEGSLFYRAETTHSQTLNDSAINGYNGISAFTSSANVEVTEFLRALGYGAKNTYNRYCYEESSPIANLFLNLKYMIDRDGKESKNSYFDPVFTSNNVQLLENNAYLPLGFLTNSQIVNLNFLDDGNRFQFQNNLMCAATGIPKNNFNILSGYCLTVTGNNLTLNAQNETGYCSYETMNDSGTISYRYTPDRDGLFCFYLDQSKRNSFSVYVNGSESALYSESYSLPQMLSVCNVEVGDQIEIRFRCPALQTGTINLCAAVLDENVFRQCYDILSASKLQLTSFENTLVEGTINCDRNGILYTSIPQDGNWEAFVDGERAHIVRVGGTMVGLNLAEGTHTVSFQYRNRAFEVGWKISAVCLFVLIGCFYFHYHPRFAPKKGKFES